MVSSSLDTSYASEEVPWTRVVLVGILAGFMSGLFGVGGGTVIVPGLAILAAFPHKLAIGTSLSAIIPIAAAGAAGYAVDGQIDWTIAMWTSLGAVVGAVGGTHLLVRLRARWLQLAFAALLVGAAVRMFIGEADGAGRPGTSIALVAGLVLIGLAAGVVAGLLGVGGGVIVVPALTVLFGVPHVLAKGTSLVVIVPTAIVGTILNRRSGFTALRPALAVGVGGIVAAAAASQVALWLDPDVAQALFGVLMVVTAVHLVRQKD